MRFAAFILMVFGAIQSAFGDLVLLNRTSTDFVSLEIKFENDSGTYTIQKIDKLAAGSKRKVSVSYKGIPSGDGSFSLGFSSQGKPYSMGFGYGPTNRSTNVLISDAFGVMKPGQSKPTERVGTRLPGSDLVLVTWVD